MPDCTWLIEAKKRAKDDTVIPAHECGRTAQIVFSRGTKTYPRCPKHASDRVITTAKDQGYDVHYLDPEQPPA